MLSILNQYLFDGFYIEMLQRCTLYSTSQFVRSGLVPLPDVGQFQFVDILTSQTIDAVSVVVNGSELVVDFGSEVSPSQSQFVYFANELLDELMSEAGIRTESFSVEVQSDGTTYVYCSPRGGQPGSVCKSLTPPDVPMIASVRVFECCWYLWYW
jgi:hypothetical protein